MKAWKEFQQLEGFLFTKYEEGILTTPEMREIMWGYARTVTDAGAGSASDRSFGPVLRQAMHLMQQALVRCHPELADELRSHMKGRER